MYHKSCVGELANGERRVQSGFGYKKRVRKSVKYYCTVAR